MEELKSTGVQEEPVVLRQEEVDEDDEGVKAKIKGRRVRRKVVVKDM